MSTRSRLGKRARTKNPSANEKRSYKQGGYKRNKVATDQGYQSSNARVGGLIGIKRKYFDSVMASANTAIGTSWQDLTSDMASDCINAMAQGTTSVTREGDRILIRKIMVRGILRRDLNTTAAAVTRSVGCRIVIVMDKSNNGANITPQDPFEAGVISTDFYQYRNLSNTQRFVILSDKKYMLDPTVAVNNASATTVSSTGQGVYFEINIPSKIVTVFDGTAGGDNANIVSNAIYILAVASDTGEVELAQMSARIRYEDA